MNKEQIRKLDPEELFKAFVNAQISRDTAFLNDVIEEFRDRGIILKGEKNEKEEI